LRQRRKDWKEKAPKLAWRNYPTVKLELYISEEEKKGRGQKSGGL
jgi:hypothetical protein